MFKAIDVWVSIDKESVARYRCFELLGRGGFCVQSKDIYRLPVDQTQIQNLEKQFVELFCEEKPDVRSGLFPTLEAAIKDFDEDFEENEKTLLSDTRKRIAEAMGISEASVARHAAVDKAAAPAAKALKISEVAIAPKSKLKAKKQTAAVREG